MFMKPLLAEKKMILKGWAQKKSNWSKQTIFLATFLSLGSPKLISRATVHMYWSYHLKHPDSNTSVIHIWCDLKLRSCHSMKWCDLCFDYTVPLQEMKVNFLQRTHSSLPLPPCLKIEYCIIMLVSLYWYSFADLIKTRQKQNIFWYLHR